MYRMSRQASHYCRVYGFTELFRWGDPCFYAGLRLDGLTLHLNASESVADRVGKANIYLFLDSGIEAFVAGAKDRGAVIVGDDLHEQDYGLKDIKFADPDGNWISFGQEV